MPPKRQSRGAPIGRAVGKGIKAVGNASTIDSSLSDKKNSLALRQTSRQASPTYSKELLDEANGKDELYPDDKRFDLLWQDVQTKMGMPKNKPIHSDGLNRIDHILRVFDLDPAYGPCLGMTRLERWKRAEKLGDDPPTEIRYILETRQGVLDYKYSVLHDKGV